MRKGSAEQQAWWCCCSSDATNPNLVVNQAVSHNCQDGSVSIRGAKKTNKNMHAAGRDGCLEMASMCSGSFAALLVSDPKTVLRTSSDKVK